MGLKRPAETQLSLLNPKKLSKMASFVKGAFPQTPGNTQAQEILKFLREANIGLRSEEVAVRSGALALVQGKLSNSKVDPHLLTTALRTLHSDLNQMWTTKIFLAIKGVPVDQTDQFLYDCQMALMQGRSQFARISARYGGSAEFFRMLNSLENYGICWKFGAAANMLLMNDESILSIGAMADYGMVSFLFFVRSMLQEPTTRDMLLIEPQSNHWRQRIANKANQILVRVTSGTGHVVIPIAWNIISFLCTPVVISWLCYYSVAMEGVRMGTDVWGAVTGSQTKQTTDPQTITAQIMEFIYTMTPAALFYKLWEMLPTLTEFIYRNSMLAIIISTSLRYANFGIISWFGRIANLPSAAGDLTRNLISRLDERLFTWNPLVFLTATVKNSLIMSWMTVLASQYGIAKFSAIMFEYVRHGWGDTAGMMIVIASQLILNGFVRLSALPQPNIFFALLMAVSFGPGNQWVVGAEQTALRLSGIVTHLTGLSLGTMTMLGIERAQINADIERMHLDQPQLLERYLRKYGIQQLPPAAGDLFALTTREPQANATAPKVPVHAIDYTSHEVFRIIRALIPNIAEAKLTEQDYFEDPAGWIQRARIIWPGTGQDHPFNLLVSDSLKNLITMDPAEVMTQWHPLDRLGVAQVMTSYAKSTLRGVAELSNPAEKFFKFFTFRNRQGTPEEISDVSKGLRNLFARLFARKTRLDSIKYKDVSYFDIAKDWLNWYAMASSQGISATPQKLQEITSTIEWSQTPFGTEVVADACDAAHTHFYWMTRGLSDAIGHNPANNPETENLTMRISGVLKPHSTDTELYNTTNEEAWRILRENAILQEEILESANHPNSIISRLTSGVKLQAFLKNQKILTNPKLLNLRIRLRSDDGTWEYVDVANEMSKILANPKATEILGRSILVSYLETCLTILDLSHQLSTLPDNNILKRAYDSGQVLSLEDTIQLLSSQVPHQVINETMNKELVSDIYTHISHGNVPMPIEVSAGQFFTVAWEKAGEIANAKIGSQYAGYKDKGTSEMSKLQRALYQEKVVQTVFGLADQYLGNLKRYLITKFTTPDVGGRLPEQVQATRADLENVPQPQPRVITQDEAEEEKKGPVTGMTQPKILGGTSIAQPQIFTANNLPTLEKVVPPPGILAKPTIRSVVHDLISDMVSNPRSFPTGTALFKVERLVKGALFRFNSIYWQWKWFTDVQYTSLEKHIPYLEKMAAADIASSNILNKKLGLDLRNNVIPALKKAKTSLAYLGGTAGLPAISVVQMSPIPPISVLKGYIDSTLWVAGDTINLRKNPDLWQEGLSGVRQAIEGGLPETSGGVGTNDEIIQKLVDLQITIGHEMEAQLKKRFPHEITGVTTTKNEEGLGVRWIGEIHTEPPKIIQDTFAKLLGIEMLKTEISNLGEGITK